VLADLATDLLRSESLDGSAVREALRARQAPAVKGATDAVVQQDPAADEASTESTAAGRRRVSG